MRPRRAAVMNHFISQSVNAENSLSDNSKSGDATSDLPNSAAEPMLLLLANTAPNVVSPPSTLMLLLIANSPLNPAWNPDELGVDEIYTEPHYLTFGPKLARFIDDASMHHFFGLYS